MAYDNPRWGCQIIYEDTNGDRKTRTLNYLNLMNVAADANSLTENGYGYTSNELKSFAQAYTAVTMGTYGGVSAVGRYDVG